MGKIIVDKGCVLVTHPGELLPDALKVLVRHVIEFDQSGPCTFDTTQQFVEWVIVAKRWTRAWVD